MIEFRFSPDQEEVFVPIALQATDFTQASEGLDFIDADALKTTAVTLASVIAMDGSETFF